MGRSGRNPVLSPRWHVNDAANPDLRSPPEPWCAVSVTRPSSPQDSLSPRGLPIGAPRPLPATPSLTLPHLPAIRPSMPQGLCAHTHPGSRLGLCPPPSSLQAVPAPSSEHEPLPDGLYTAQVPLRHNGGQRARPLLSGALLYSHRSFPFSAKSLGTINSSVYLPNWRGCPRYVKCQKHLLTCII